VPSSHPEQRGMCGGSGVYGVATREVVSTCLNRGRRVRETGVQVRAKERQITGIGRLKQSTVGDHQVVAGKVP